MGHKHDFAVDAACDGCGVMLSELVQVQQEQIANLRAQLATHATTIDRLSDANSVLAKECDQARAKLDEAKELHRQCMESHGSTFGADWSNWKAAEARVRRLEEALRQYAIGLDGHYVHCPGEKFHGRPEHDCLAIQSCETIRALL